MPQPVMSKIHDTRSQYVKTLPEAVDIGLFQQDVPQLTND